MPVGILVVGLRMFGAAVAVAAMGWWWLAFEPLITGELLSWPEAAQCLISSNDICTLAQSLCRSSHPFGVTRYGTDLLWLGVALLGFGLILPARGRES
jgi:hypothetical protein